MRKYVYFIIVVIIITILIVAGIIIFNNSVVDNNQQMEDIIEKQQNDITKNLVNSNMDLVETVNEIEKVSPNCIFIFKTYFKKCEHIKVEKEQASETMVNKTRDDLEKIYKDWNIVTFRNDEVLLYKEEEGICDEHYLLKELDGYIAIYTLDENENQTLKETTAILMEYLPEEDKTRIKDGIRVNGKEQLNRTLEDYE